MWIWRLLRRRILMRMGMSRWRVTFNSNGSSSGITDISSAVSSFRVWTLVSVYFKLVHYLHPVHPSPPPLLLLPTPSHPPRLGPHAHPDAYRSLSETLPGPKAQVQRSFFRTLTRHDLHHALFSLCTSHILYTYDDFSVLAYLLDYLRTYVADFQWSS